MDDQSLVAIGKVCSRWESITLLDNVMTKLNQTQLESIVEGLCHSNLKVRAIDYMLRPFWRPIQDANTETNEIDRHKS